MAKEISGIAIFPRLSENDVFYWPQELKKFDGVTVPLRWNHIQTPEAIIGEATFKYDPENRQVLYRATITNEDVQKEVDKGFYKVSIGASVSEDGNPMCHSDGTCVENPIIDKPEELSIVSDPGIPESSINILEKKECTELNCTAPVHINKITSHKDNNITIEAMTDKVKEDCDCQKSTETPEAPKVEAPVPETKEQECPPGQQPGPDGKCVPVEKEVEADAATKDVTVNVNVPESKNEDIEKIVDSKIEKFMDEVRKEWKPKAEVAVSEGKSEDHWLVEEAKANGNMTDEQVISKVLNEGHVRLVLNKEDWINKYTAKGSGVTEAVTTSGTIPGVKQSADVVIVPGSNSFKPIRQFGQFEAIPTGQNTARFYTLDVAAFGAITESTSTDITASTNTFTAIDVTCSARGWLQQVLKSNLEDWPSAFLNKLKETARLAAIKDEHNLIVQTMASTDNDFGGTTTAPYHISGTDGSAVTTTTLEDATAEFLREGFEFGRSLLEQQGHDPINETFVAVISPRAYRTLQSDSDLARWVQQGDPSISKLGRIEQFLGIQIIVSNELLTQNNSYRNIIMVKGKAFALASQRDMELEMTKEIRGQFVDIVASHRIGVDEIDKSAYIIVSSKQD